MSALSAADIRFRNVAVNSEHGLATCDENGCANFLRPSRYPYENAVHDVVAAVKGGDEFVEVSEEA